MNLYFKQFIYRIIVILSLILPLLSPECASAQTAPRGSSAADSVAALSDRPIERDLEEVVVKKKRYKYSKKNNPAVELINRVREDSKKTDPLTLPHYSFDRYDKIVIGVNDFYADLNTTKLSAKMDFIRDFIDTASYTGRRILDLSVKEKLTRVIHRDSPRADKEVVVATYSRGIDEAFNKENMRGMLEDVMREINIYSNDITLMQNRFVSPLSHIGPDYYKYFITDTVVVDGKRCVDISFAPHTPESFGFNGDLFIPLDDSVKYVKRITMRVPKAINLNYVDNIFVQQNFSLDSLGLRRKTVDDLSLEIQVMPGTPKLYGRRFSGYDNISYEPEERFSEFYDAIGSSIVLDNAERSSSAFWNPYRLEPLSAAETRMGSFLTRMRKVPALYWTEKLLRIFVEGYIGTLPKGSKFDIGPVNTFVSYNTVEGMRLRFGGMTTAALSPHLFGRGYLAYGCKDRKFKYNAELEYSFTKKKLHFREFPVNGISLSHNYDIDQPGQHYLFTNADNVFLSWKRRPSILVTYRRLTRLDYKLELPNNFSVEAGVRHETQEATPRVPFVDGSGSSLRRYSEAGARLSLRYAPGEKFIQGRSMRAPLNLDAFELQLTHEFAPKGLLNSRFTLNKTEISARKRFWFSAFGYADVILKGGILWSQVDYPALLWPNANLSYTIQPESYSLMNPMEFANDRYASLDLTYWMNGLVFNRVPMVKKLKLREIFTFKLLTGSLSRKNNPELNENLFRFPAEAAAVNMHGRPYMEIGAGIDNILTILRVDYIWRLTYRETPASDRSGLRISLHFSF